MSLWTHLWTPSIMQYPPAIACVALVVVLQWAECAVSGTLDQQGGVKFSSKIAPDARWPLLQHVLRTREVGGITSEPRRRLCAGGSSFIARSGCTRGTLSSSNPPVHPPCSRNCSLLAQNTSVLAGIMDGTAAVVAAALPRAFAAPLALLHVWHASRTGSKT